MAIRAVVWIAGVAMLAAGLAAAAVHTPGYTRLERNQRRLLAAEEPGDTES